MTAASRLPRLERGRRGRRAFLMAASSAMLFVTWWHAMERGGRKAQFNDDGMRAI
jgi:hypothetical protein